MSSACPRGDHWFCQGDIIRNTGDGVFFATGQWEIQEIVLKSMNGVGGFTMIFNRGQQPQGYHGNIFFCWEKSDHGTMTHKITPPLGGIVNFSPCILQPHWLDPGINPEASRWDVHNNVTFCHHIGIYTCITGFERSSWSLSSAWGNFQEAQMYEKVSNVCSRLIVIIIRLQCVDWGTTRF